MNMCEWLLELKNMEKWEKICKVNGKKFTKKELYMMVKELQELSKDSEAFQVAYRVLLTEYDKELQLEIGLYD